MKEVARETYDLPIYDSPLRFWGLAADYAPEKEPNKDSDETKGSAGETITIIQREGQFKYDKIETIYKREDGTSDRYNFEVINPEYRECVFRGANSQEVPWPVRRALERFGFHDKETPSSDRNFVFDHLLSVLSLIEKRVDEDELILRSWLAHLVSGLHTFSFFVSFENQLPYEEYKMVIDSMIDIVDDSGWWYSDSEYSQEIIEHVYEDLDIESPVYFPRKDSYALISPDELREHRPGQDTKESSEEPTTIVTLTPGQDESSRYIFATHKSRYAFDRYRFVDRGDNEVHLERDDGFDFPPYTVIRELENHDVEIANLHTFSPDDTLSELILTADAVVRWVRKHFKMDHRETIAAYSRYITRLDKALGLAILLEQNPDAYHRNHETLLNTLDLPSTEISSKTLSLSGSRSAIGPFIRLFDEDAVSIMEETYEEINLRERRDEYGKMKEELERDSELTDTIS